MRRAARVDENQPEIVRVLRDVGASVKTTHTVGDGFGDLVVGFRQTNFLLEVKDGSKPPSQRKLTEDEERFRNEWQGQYAVVESPEDALRVIGAI